MLDEVIDSSFLPRLRVPRPAHIASRQIQTLLLLLMPALERVLCRITELTDRQTRSFAQLDVEPHSSNPILV